MLDIEALIRDFNQRKPEALTILHTLYYRELCSYSNWIIDDMVEATWIANGAFVKIYVSEKQFNTLQNIKSYLYAIVRNDSLNHLKADGKSKKDRQQFVLLSDKKDEMEDTAGLLEDEVARCEQITQLIKKMPEMRQKVACHLFIDGLSIRQTAERLGLKESTVYNHREAARKEIFNAVGKHPFFDPTDNEED